MARLEQASHGGHSRFRALPNFKALHGSAMLVVTLQNMGSGRVASWSRDEVSMLCWMGRRCLGSTLLEVSDAVRFKQSWPALQSLVAGMGATATVALWQARLGWCERPRDKGDDMLLGTGRHQGVYAVISHAQPNYSASLTPVTPCTPFTMSDIPSNAQLVNAVAPPCNTSATLCPECTWPWPQLSRTTSAASWPTRMCTAPPPQAPPCQPRNMRRFGPGGLLQSPAQATCSARTHTHKTPRHRPWDLACPNTALSLQVSLACSLFLPVVVPSPPSCPRPLVPYSATRPTTLLVRLADADQLVGSRAGAEADHRPRGQLPRRVGLDPGVRHLGAMGWTGRK